MHHCNLNKFAKLIRNILDSSKKENLVSFEKISKRWNFTYNSKKWDQKEKFTTRFEIDETN